MPEPVRAQVSGHMEISASDCQCPRLAALSGTQRATPSPVCLATRPDQAVPQRCRAAWRVMPSREPISAQE
jgi:hypothetical protein